MKKTICLVLMLTFLLSVGCARVPPVRIAEEEITSVVQETMYTVDTAYADADLVALLRIGAWLGESEDNYVSYYEAKIEKIFKGEAQEKIVLVQDGNSAYTIQGFPLFIPGNELLVFLKSTEAPDYENAFRIEGSHTTFFDAARIGRDLYYLDRYGVLGDSETGCENLFFDTDLRDRLCASLEKQDSLVKDRRYHFIYSADQMDAYLGELKSGE